MYFYSCFKYLIIVAIVFASCKSKKTLTNVELNKNIDEIIDHLKVDIPQYIHLKSKITYKTEQENRKISVDIKIKKNEMILINLSFFGFSLAKAQITPNNIRFCNYSNKTFFEGDFKIIPKLIGIPLNFYSLQSILVGKNVLPINAKDYQLDTPNYKYKLSSKNKQIQHNLIVNPNDFLVDREIFLDKDLRFQTKIHSQKIKNLSLPKKIELNVNTEKMVNIKIEYKSVKIPKNLNFNYEIPDNYKQVFFN